ncbi:MAG: methyl-accepting chemotaxis protein [Moorellaceae bacterium]
MFRKSLRNKVMALVLATMLVTVAAQLIIYSLSLSKVTVRSQALSQDHLLSEVQTGLKNTVEAMVSSLTDTYKSSAATMSESQLVELVKRTLSAARYGEAGYFFAYRFDGTRLVAPENKSQEGQNFWDLVDKSGKKVVQEFIKTAQNGGGYVSYIWLNPKTQREEEKISYVAPLQLGTLQLVVGTGTYLPMIEAAQNDIAREMNRIKDEIYTLILVSSLVLLLLLAAVAYFFARSLTTPLLLAVEHLGVMAGGDFTRAVPDGLLRQKDEIGRLAQALERLQADLRPLMAELKADAQTLSGNSEALRTAAEEIASSSGEVARAIQQVAAGASEQAGHLQDILHLIEDITSSLEKVDSELSQVKANSVETSRLAGVGKKELDLLIASIEEAREAFKAVATKLTGLSGSVDQVGEIVEVINGIAEQTNLLALNAAIEAARAGEAGRGFAVVADEVRKLAEQSRTSSDKIKALLNTIASETQEVVNTSEEVSRQVIAQLERVENTVRAFDDILEAVAAMAPMIEETYRQVDNTVRAKDVVLDRVQNISAVSEETAASAQEISASAEELSASTEEIASHAQQVLSVAKRLEEQVERFQV